MKARSDFFQAVFWLLAGGAIFFASWTMDRLEKIGVQPFSAPGLLPGILGVLLMLLGAILLVRSLRSSKGEAAEHAPVAPVQWRRLLFPIALCLAYAGGLVGRVPFWLASWLFVAAMIWTLQYREAKAKGGLPRLAASAAAIGLGVGVVVSLVFQQLFLIRLP